MALIRSTSAFKDYDTVTAIAIDTDKNSQYAVKWGVENILKKSPRCVLIHVLSRSFTPQDAAEAVPKEGRAPTESEVKQFFLSFKGFCVRKGITAKEVILHDIDVPSAIIDYVTNNHIQNIVVGASNRSSFLRKFTRGMDVATSILKQAPESCSVYVISKGKTHAVRSATQSPQHTPKHYSKPETRLIQSFPEHSFSEDSDVSYDGWSRGSLLESSRSDRVAFSRARNPSRQSNCKDLKIRRNAPQFSMSSNSSDGSSQGTRTSDASDLSGAMSYHSSEMSSERSDFSMQELDAEMRRLKLEIQQSMKLYDSTYKVGFADRSEVKPAEDGRLDQDTTLALVEKEREKTRAAMEAAMKAQQLADAEVQKRKEAEMRAQQVAEYKKMEKETGTQNTLQYRRYMVEEIEDATEGFSSSHQIGEGGYGPVFKAFLDRTPVAIKILRDMSEGQSQFQKEVEVLSRIRHPQMVLLLGACPEYGCLVYEYMENGSLEDRLFCKGNTPPLPWTTRFKIAAEIATGLLFLHQTKPEPLVHRDFKPANILLGQNYASKISDVGLARLIPSSSSSNTTQYRMTAAAGTFCYIDPEYQQTGMLSVKSDVYSLGIVLLQLITAQPPMGLAYKVEDSIDNGTFKDMLDPLVRDWPFEEALSIAKLALGCSELRKRDRPDLATVVLPELKRLQKLALHYEASKGGNIMVRS